MELFEELFQIEICQDCHDMFDDEVELDVLLEAEMAHLIGVKWGDANIRVVHGEPWFSWAACHACGSTFGGMRYGATVEDVDA